MSESPLEELLSIVQRDLAAETVHVIDAGAEPPLDEASLLRDLPGGRRLVVTWTAPPIDLEARSRRLDMLVTAFGETLESEGRARASRPPPALSLQEELAALAQRASAVEAVIIDAFSPVVWGSVGPLADHAARIAERLPALRGGLHAVDADDLALAASFGLASAQGLRVDPSAARLVPRAICVRHQLLPISRSGDELVVAMVDPRDADAIRDVILITGLRVEPVFSGDAMAAFFRHLDDDDDPRTYDEVMAQIPAADRAAREEIARAARDDWARTLLARRAIAAVRALPEADGLHKGGQLRHTVAGDDLGYVARSFSSIYIIIVVFSAPFDELLVKRALSHAMPTIERLVAALPPQDPPPNTRGAVAIRAPRRRR
ncbi:Type IV fimbrial assembly, ATPase PilB [Minicystis rosea]|nr:Type IV fimbrial assembly, ATPase PilB [Minicystis rosea]